MLRLLTYFLLLLPPFCSGCAGLVTFEAQHEVRLRTSERVGHGAIVAPNRVVTVQHVVGERQTVSVATRGAGGWVEAKVARVIPAVPEPLVELELPVSDSLFAFSGFASYQVLERGLGLGSQIRTHRGARPLSGAYLRPGDSGAPILNAQGQLVGLLSGRDRRGKALCAAFPRNSDHELARRLTK